MRHLKTKIIALAIVAIIILGGVVVAFYALSNDDDDERMNTDEVAAVYGNANNDYTIDSLDRDLIQDIVDGKAVWDRTANPFADANNDGSVTQADVEQVNRIINRESTDIWYYNGFGEAQRLSFPVDTSRIAVTYWQESEAMGILGLWDNVVLVNPSNRNDTALYDFSKTEWMGNADTGTLDSEQVQQILSKDVTLIVASPSDPIRTYAEPLEAQGVQTTYLRGTGEYCLGTILTLGLLFDQEERGQKFVQYWVDLQELLDQRVPDVSERPTATIVMVHGYNEQRFIGSYGGMFTFVNNPSGAWQLISKIANVYTTDVTGSVGQGRNHYGIDWFIQNPFDYIIVLGSGIGAKSQEDYNTWFETIAPQFFANTQEYNNGNIIGMTNNFSGYSAYALMPILMWMLYPDQFSYDEMLQIRQSYYDQFVPLAPDCTTLYQYYTGTGYDASYI